MLEGGAVAQQGATKSARSAKIGPRSRVFLIEGRRPADSWRLCQSLAELPGYFKKGLFSETPPGAAMKYSALPDELAQEMREWVWTYSAAELERLQPEIADWLAQNRLDLCQLLARQVDDTLVVAIQKGFFKELAFAELFRNRYEERLRGRFLKWGAEWNAAFDLTQGVFINFLVRGLRRYQPSCEPTSRFWGYLHKAAYNFWIAKEIRPRRPELVNLNNRAGDTDVLLEVQRREAEARLVTALGQLPAELREVLELQIDGFSPAQAATKMGMPVKSFYGLLHRARKRLQEMLGIELPPSTRGRPRKENPMGPEDPDSEP